MLHFITYLFLMVFISIALFFLANYVIQKKPKFRPIGAIILSFLAAYSLSFLLDMVVEWIYGILKFNNMVFPLITWIYITVILFIIAKHLSTKIIQVSIAYFVIGIVAIVAAFVGHFYNFYVGLLMVGMEFLQSILMKNDRLMD